MTGLQHLAVQVLKQDRRYQQGKQPKNKQRQPIKLWGGSQHQSYQMFRCFFNDNGSLITRHKHHKYIVATVLGHALFFLEQMIYFKKSSYVKKNLHLLCYLTWVEASVSPHTELAKLRTDSQNSSKSPFLAWFEIPVIASPRACQKIQKIQMTHTHKISVCVRVRDWERVVYVRKWDVDASMYLETHAQIKQQKPQTLDFSITASRESK